MTADSVWRAHAAPSFTLPRDAGEEQRWGLEPLNIEPWIVLEGA